MRLPTLLNEGLWRDEANVYVQLSAPDFIHFFGRVTATEWHPPLFFFVMYAWTKVAHFSELSLKIIPFAFSILAVGAVYRLGRGAASSGTGLIAAAFYAVAPIAIVYSSEYLYPLMGLLCTILAWQVMEARQRLTPAGGIAVAIVTFFTIFTHYIALFYVPILIVWSLFSHNTARQRVGLVSSLLLGSLPFLFWAHIFLSQRRIGIPYAMQTVPLAKMAFFFAALIAYMPTAPFILDVIFLAIILAGIVVAARSTAIQSDPLVLGAIFFTALIFITAENLLAVRYVFHFYGLLCVFLAWVAQKLISAMRRTNRRGWIFFGLPGLCAICLVMLVADISFAFRNGLVPKSGVRTLALRETIGPETLYVTAPDYLASTFAFYSRASHPTIRGFVRWKNPEIFRLAGYSDDWNNSRAVDATVKSIGAAACRFRHVNLLVDRDAHRQGQIRYERIWVLLKRLHGLFPLLGRTAYPGRYESIFEYRFLLPNCNVTIKNRGPVFRTAR